METVLVESREVKSLGGKTVIDVAPSPGVVGLVMAGFLIEVLKAEKIAELYSPHFPQVSVVNSEGVATLPKVELYDINPTDGGSRGAILIMRNFFVDSSEAGDEAAHLLYEYLVQRGAGELFLITSGRITGTGDIYISSSKLELSRSLIQLGAKNAPPLDSLPLDKLASFLLLRYHLSERPLYLVICDTSSYMPDLAAARKTLLLLSRHIGINIDLTRLDQEIEKQRSVIEELERSVRAIEDVRERAGGRPSYIG